MNNFFKISKRNYFSYPCPRKLREIVKMTMFERETSENIKDIWKKYYDDKPRALGMSVSSTDMELMVEK
jgi:ATP synthase F1 complex assembly factor 1